MKKIKILFISNSDGIDYECHCLFHGLNELEHVEVYTIYDQSYMFSDYPQLSKGQLYGMGFTIAASIDPIKKRNLQMSDAENKIKSSFFDIIIYGHMHRCLDFWDVVTSYYSKRQIICIDGEDWIRPYFTKDHLVKSLLKKGVGLLNNRKELYYYYDKIVDNGKRLKECPQKAVVFKRELDKTLHPLISPISFAIPEKKIVDKINKKKRLLAYIIPGKTETYIYKTESDYYHGYQESYWGMTFKKAGWDCLRHYEILGNGCIPYFPDINKCPDSIMTNFPKNYIKYTNQMYENGINGGWEVEYYLKVLLDYTKTYLTTRSLANYVLSSVI